MLRGFEPCTSGCCHGSSFHTPYPARNRKEGNITIKSTVALFLASCSSGAALLGRNGTAFMVDVSIQPLKLIDKSPIYKLVGGLHQLPASFNPTSLYNLQHPRLLTPIMSGTWNEAARKQLVAPHASLEPTVTSKKVADTKSNYIEGTKHSSTQSFNCAHALCPPVFPEVGDQGFASLFPDSLTGIPADLQNSFTTSATQPLLVTHEIMNTTVATTNGTQDSATPQQILPSELQATLSNVDQLPGSLLWGPLGCESLNPSSQTTPSSFAIDTLHPESGEGIQVLRLIVQDQLRQICALQTQIHSYHQRCLHYRDKANTYKALYTQQQSLAEHTMSSLIRLRQSHVQAPGPRRQ